MVPARHRCRVRAEGEATVRRRGWISAAAGDEDAIHKGLDGEDEHEAQELPGELPQPLRLHCLRQCRRQKRRNRMRHLVL